jgi:cytochrome oxidase Cu insertion factor (SCO1/SenC/PrrC family)
MLYGYVVLLFVFFYTSRFLNENYLGYLAAFLTLALVIDGGTTSKDRTSAVLPPRTALRRYYVPHFEGKINSYRSEKMLKENDVAPDFELLADTGQPTKLSDFKGKRVLLYFFPKAMTSG